MKKKLNDIIASDGKTLVKRFGKRLVLEIDFENNGAFINPLYAYETIFIDNETNTSHNSLARVIDDIIYMRDNTISIISINDIRIDIEKNNLIHIDKL